MLFNFHNPELLWLLLLIPAIAYYSTKIGPSAGILFSSTELTHGLSIKQKFGSAKLLFFMRLIALAALIIAVARPQFGKGETVVEASGIDIILAVDMSGSMLALDFSTREKIITRMEVVKEVIEDFIENRSNDRIGIIAFAGNPYLVSPLTLNHSWLLRNLKRLKPGLVEDGTAIGTALAMSVNRLKDIPSKSRVIILLTDGENNAGNIPPLVAAELAETFGTKVYTIAAGTQGRVFSYGLTATGDIAIDEFGNNLFYEFDSVADTETLYKIAEITGGRAFNAANRADLDNIYSEINRLEKSDVKLKQYAHYDDFFAYPLILGLLTIGFERILGHTRFRRLP